MTYLKVLYQGGSDDRFQSEPDVMGERPQLGGGKWSHQRGG